MRFLAVDAGIRQFLHIGTGLPSEENVHQVAQSTAPEARIVYVDNDRCKSGCAHATPRAASCVKRTGRTAEWHSVILVTG